MKLDAIPTPEREVTVSPDELLVDGDNPNEQSDEMFGLLCDNLKENGWIGNAIVANTGDLPGYDGDAEGLIADGEHRWRAAQEIDLEEVPVKFYDFEDDAERRLWRQELNKISGEHDKKRDALEYDFLLNEGRSDEVQELTKAADEDLDDLLERIKQDTGLPVKYDYDPDHNVYFEDCVEGMSNRLEDNSVDCIVTDPPYGVDWDTNSREKENNLPGTVDGDRSVEEAIELWQSVVTELHRVLRSEGHLYCFADWRTEYKFREVLENAGFDIRNVLVWDKERMGLGGVGTVNYRTRYELAIFATLNSPRSLQNRGADVLEHQRADTTEQSHPTEKPTGLLSQLVTNSTHEGDTVLDPFMGSGTTATVAIQNNRDYVGFEIDEENYRSVIERRIGEAKRAREAGINQDE